jgi:hypothetical protein
MHEKAGPTVLTPLAIALSHSVAIEGPSMASAIGSTARNAKAVITAKALPGSSMFSPLSVFLESFFERTPRSEKARLEPIANAKQSQVKLRSAADAMPTPPTTGSRHAFTCDGM